MNYQKTQGPHRSPETNLAQRVPTMYLQYDSVTYIFIFLPASARGDPLWGTHHWVTAPYYCTLTLL